LSTGSHSEASGWLFRSVVNSRSSSLSISLSFLFLVLRALGRGEEVSDKSDIEVRGEQIEDDALTEGIALVLWTGANKAKAQAELKVCRPFGFLAGGLSLGSVKPIAALQALIPTVRLKLTSSRVAVRFLGENPVQ
jgi:hypothetical protein